MIRLIFNLIHMSIEQLIHDIKKLQEDVKAITASIKDLKPKNEDLEMLKRQRKDLSQQIKDMDSDIERQMNEDQDIVEFKKEKMEKDEKLAKLKQELFIELDKVHKDFSLDVQCEDGFVKVNALKAMRLYLNGKELVNKLRP